LKIKITFFLLGFYTITNAQVFRNYSNEFLNIGVDAAALGMSKAVVASSNDVNATYWNPAGLVGIDEIQGSLMHASYFAGIANYNHAAVALPIDNKSTVGFSLIRFGVDDILNTTELIDSNGNIDFNRVSLFSSVDYAFTGTYARNLLFPDVKFGVNAKIVRRIIGDFANSWGFGFDVGFQVDKRDWKFGVLIRDITTTFNTWIINEDEFQKIRDANFFDDSNVTAANQELPTTTELTKPKMQIGAARDWRISRSFFLMAEVDANVRFGRTNDLISSDQISVDPAIGFELNYEGVAYLRTGVGNFQYIAQPNDADSLSLQPNLGIGFKFRGIQIDYALTNIGSVGNALYSNIFSLKFDLSYF
jgi:hypothetical protein